MLNEKTLGNVILQRRKDPLLELNRELVVAPSPGQEAAQFNDSERADVSITTREFRRTLRFSRFRLRLIE